MSDGCYESGRATCRGCEGASSRDKARAELERDKRRWRAEGMGDWRYGCAGCVMAALLVVGTPLMALLLVMSLTDWAAGR